MAYLLIGRKLLTAVCCKFASLIDSFNVDFFTDNPRLSDCAFISWQFYKLGMSLFLTSDAKFKRTFSSATLFSDAVLSRTSVSRVTARNVGLLICLRCLIYLLILWLTKYFSVSLCHRCCRHILLKLNPLFKQYIWW